ncbi:MAG: hypothetical protein AAF657_40375, partial [Acidobacteriota bacterium]
YGEGMDRRIIDTKLTRLFSSGKEDDFTKIGRFGIGFVSVFAIHPDAVVVDTSRGGESWRVLFKKDRTFERIALDLPMDGTTIRIVKQVSEKAYAALRGRASQVISYWCRHVRPEVRVDGEAINQPLDIDSPCKVRQREEGTEVVAAYVTEGARSNGYYNRGITLLEEPATASVCFRVDSRYLEHTLTRDNVLRDENYDKAMARVSELLEETLPAHLFSELHRHVEEGGEIPPPLLAFAASQLQAWGARHGGPEGAFESGRIPEARIFATHSGAALSVREAVAAGGAGRLFTAAVVTPVVEALARRGDRVVACAKGDGVHRLLTILVEKPPEANEAFCLPLPLEWPGPSHRVLAAGIHRSLEASGAKVAEVRFGHLGYEGSAVADRVALVQRTFGELTPIGDVHDLPTQLLARRRQVVINADHPTVERLLQLVPREPELAAYVAVKLLYLRGHLTPELDTRLVTAAVERRWKRLRA